MKLKYIYFSWYHKRTINGQQRLRATKSEAAASHVVIHQISFTKFEPSKHDDILQC